MKKPSIFFIFDNSVNINLLNPPNFEYEKLEPIEQSPSELYHLYRTTPNTPLKRKKKKLLSLSPSNSPKRNHVKKLIIDSQEINSPAIKSDSSSIIFNNLMSQKYSNKPYSPCPKQYFFPLNLKSSINTNPNQITRQSINSNFSSQITH